MILPFPLLSVALIPVQNSVMAEQMLHHSVRSLTAKRETAAVKLVKDKAGSSAFRPNRGYSLKGTLSLVPLRYRNRTHRSSLLETLPSFSSLKVNSSKTMTAPESGIREKRRSVCD